MIRETDEAGSTLVELLISASLMLVILIATLQAMEIFQKNNARTTDLINFIDAGRNAMGRLTRDLRGATASSTSAVPDASVVMRAGPHDIVVKRINPHGRPSPGNVNAVQTVRWCLEPAAQRLHRQVAAGSAEAPSACPGTAAGFTDTVVASQIVNGARPVFTYDRALLTEITTVSAFLAVDRNVLQPPAEATLTSGIFLRNQNRVPIASFDFIALAGRNVQLNAQASRDPEGGILTYEWKDAAAPLPYLSAVASYVAPASSVRSITLTVRDIDGLSASQTQNVTVLP